MRIGVVLILSVLLLGGCSTCQLATFYKPLMNQDSRWRTDQGLPTHASMTLDEVPFSIAVCADKYLAPPADSVALCLALALDAGKVLRFSEPAVMMAVGSAPPQAVAMMAVEYEIFCRDNKGERICTSTEESPIAGPVDKVSTAGPTDRYAFNPAFEFHGAKDSLHQGAWFGHRSAGKRQYLLRTLTVPAPPGAALSVQLPAVIINGQQLSPPTLKFRAVTEEICRMLPLA